MRLVSICLFMLALAIPARADQADECTNNDNWEIRIGACTAVIRSGDYQGEGLAWAFNNRGWAYYNLGEHSRALEDLNQALTLDPGMPTAITNRGSAYRKLCRYEASIKDFQRAIEFVGTSRAREWQEFLRDLGFYSGPIDGKFGSASRKALVSYVYGHSC